MENLRKALTNICKEDRRDAVVVDSPTNDTYKKLREESSKRLAQQQRVAAEAYQCIEHIVFGD